MSSWDENIQPYIWGCCQGEMLLLLSLLPCGTSQVALSQHVVGCLEVREECISIVSALGTSLGTGPVTSVPVYCIPVFSSPVWSMFKAGVAQNKECSLGVRIWQFRLSITKSSLGDAPPKGRGRCLSWLSHQSQAGGGSLALLELKKKG